MVEKMDDASTTLRLLQNDVRRGILERLVREPHYPMQLAELLNVSQPAINKHLKELERGGLVTKEKVPSCLLYTSPSPRDDVISRMPSSA